MAICVNHPDRQAQYTCTKHNLSFCEDCLHCVDPELYCKSRTSCPIWFVHKEKAREERRKADSGGNP